MGAHGPSWADAGSAYADNGLATASGGTAAGNGTLHPRLRQRPGRNNAVTAPPPPSRKRDSSRPRSQHKSSPVTRREHSRHRPLTSILQSTGPGKKDSRIHCDQFNAPDFRNAGSITSECLIVGPPTALQSTQCPLSFCSCDEEPRGDETHKRERTSSERRH
jgi:hypothetical protein